MAKKGATDNNVTSSSEPRCNNAKRGTHPFDDNLGDYLKLYQNMGDEQGAQAVEARIRAIKEQ